MIRPRHRASLGGSIAYCWPEATGEPALVLDDTALLRDDDVARLGLDLIDHVTISGRPSRITVESVAAQMADVGGGRLVAVGSGALLDAAKLAFQRLGEAGVAAELVMLPCGAEPYRAVAQFAVVDAPDGSRPTVVDRRFASCDVIVLDDLLDRLPQPIIALAAADTAVHAIESLLSSAATPYSRMLASASLRSVCQTLEPASVVTASFVAVEAFASTGLGLAHAVASPLGTELGLCHDAINAVLGDALVDYWSGRTPSFALVAEACNALSFDDVRTSLAQLRNAAALPSSLSEFGIGWERVARVLPRAARSSGMTVLPQPVSSVALEAFAARGWKGATTKEAALAEPAGAN